MRSSVCSTKGGIEQLLARQRLLKKSYRLSSDGKFSGILSAMTVVPRGAGNDHVHQPITGLRCVNSKIMAESRPCLNSTSSKQRFKLAVAQVASVRGDMTISFLVYNIGTILWPTKKKGIRKAEKT